jgi:hypothetical protein
MKQMSGFNFLDAVDLFRLKLSSSNVTEARK